MGDFIELGLEGADKLIDKHFDKVPDKYVKNLPDKYVDSDQWVPKRLRKGSKEEQNQHRHPQQHRNSNRDGGRRPDDDHYHRDENLGDSAYFENDETRRQQRAVDNHNNNHLGGTYTPLTEANMAAANHHNQGRPVNNANSGPYFEDGPYITPPFTTMPQPHSPQFAPPPSRDGRGDYYYPDRPGQRRRSSSYHGPRRHDDFYYSSDSDDDRNGRVSFKRNDQQLAVRNRSSTRTHDSRRERRDSSSNGVLDNIKDNFTDSKEGLAGGALGALVGGYVTHKVLESRGGGKNDEKDMAWTALGAAVSGLAVNAVVDKFEDRRKANKRDARMGRERIAERRATTREGERDGGHGRARSERSGGGGAGRGGRDWDSDYDDRRYYH